jgi:iron(III) transport system ATP-binding protein
MMPVCVECLRLRKCYNGAAALDGLSLEVQPGEILALVGPSGCGKTTLLRLIAGFEGPDGGQICLNSLPAAGEGVFVPPEKRRVGMVFQDFALFPHLTVEENVAFGIDRLSRSQRERESGRLLELVGLAGCGSRYPHELSGGERQRVALARALAPRPLVLLFDEPFSNLDTDRRVQMREEVRGILKELKATAIFVTHDQEEALFMGDRLAVMNRGRVEQVGLPEEVFQNPATRFTAEFIGQADFLPGEVTAEGIQTEVGLLYQEAGLPSGSLVEVAFRADDVSFWPQEGAPARVEARRFQGMASLYRLRLPSGRLLHALQPHTCQIGVGACVQVRAEPGHALACFPIVKAG